MSYLAPIIAVAIVTVFFAAKWRVTPWAVLRDSFAAWAGAGRRLIRNSRGKR